MHYFLSLFITTAFCINSNCNNSVSDLSDPLSAMRFVKAVQKRNYLVHRLEKPIKSLLKFYEIHKKDHHFNIWDLFDHHQSHSKKIPIGVGLSDQFLHPVVKRCMRDVEEGGDIKAVHRLWSDFLSYKYIESDLFVREAITAIILLYKNVVLHALSIHITSGNSLISKKQKEHRDVFIDENIDEEIDEIDLGNSQDLYDSFDSIANLLSESYEDGDFVINNNMRFYHIQRLLKSIIVLSKFMSKHADYSKHYVYDFTQLPFTNKIIRLHVARMHNSQSMAPLFGLWHNVVSYKYIDDTLFLHEFSILLHIIHQQIAADFYGATVKNNPSLHDMIELYEAISDMPIPELLNSLDVVVDQCIEIIEKYELDSSMSWQSWIKKYWWMPPVVIASAVINFLLKNKISHATSSDT